jgi:hypothetical protein
VTLRTPVGALLTLLLLTATGCTGGDDEPTDPSAAPTAAGPSDTTPSEDAPSDEPSGDAEEAPVEPGTPEVAAGEGCAEVRAGIDAFNVGDYDETVERFEAAVPLVEADADGTEASNQLVEAVRWYAELPAEDYLESSLTSSEFERYKAITLGQCIDALLEEPTPSEPGLDT